MSGGPALRSPPTTDRVDGSLARWLGKRVGPSKSKPVAVLDYPWVAMESPRHPMHVGGLIILQAPQHAPADFVAAWVESMRLSVA